MSGVAVFWVRREVDGPAAFAVVDLDGPPVPEVGAFLCDLAERDRSAYTQRAYALGVADFFGWLAARGLVLEAVDRSVVSAYIADYRAGGKGGATRVDVARIGRVDGRTRKPAPALERQPATVNHRLAVLASFFSFVIGRDRERGVGSWLGAENPVPRAGGGMEGSHGMPGRDAPRRARRGELRQRVPRRLRSPIGPANWTAPGVNRRSDRQRRLLLALPCVDVLCQPPSALADVDLPSSAARSALSGRPLGDGGAGHPLGGR